MDDVKPEVTDVAPEATSAEVPASPQPPAATQPAAEEQTADVAENKAEPQQRTVPLTALQQERKLRQEAQRQLADAKAARQVPAPQEQGDDWETVISHPFVQNLMLQNAKRELTDYARDLFDQHPNVPDHIKKAILKNPRGFVQEETTDTENAKLDLLEYIESLEEGIVQPQPAKAFPVAATNATSSQSAVRPADIQRILEKPVEDMTKDEEKMVADYLATSPK